MTANLRSVWELWQSDLAAEARAEQRLVVRAQKLRDEAKRKLFVATTRFVDAAAHNSLRILHKFLDAGQDPDTLHPVSCFQDVRASQSLVLHPIVNGFAVCRFWVTVHFTALWITTI